jgi:acetyl esterase/lipase
MSILSIDLWPNGNPDGWSRSDQEATEVDEGNKWKLVRNVSRPTLDIHPPLRPRKDAPMVMVCPGGGYWIEAIEHEGTEIVERLNRDGFYAALLKYRLPNRDADKPLHKAPLQDAQRAIRLLRARWEELHFGKVGAMGFSAGGHLVAALSTAEKGTYAEVDGADKQNCRPDFAGLIYPAYLDSEGEPVLPVDIVVKQDTAPAFIVQTMDDKGLVISSFSYALACQRAHVPAELHMFAKGGHGYGLRSKEAGISSWMDLFEGWLSRMDP